MYMNIEIQFVPILIMTVIATVLGMLWFGPRMFGKKWMQYMGHDEATLNNPVKMKELDKGMGLWYGLQFVATFIMLGALSLCLTSVSGSQVYIVTGFLWLGFVVPIGATNEIWSMTASKHRLPKFLISSTYQLVVMLIAAFIFTAFK